ncbi:MAG TPA: hypothetical protein DHW22_01045 [Planctomycetaceae bacterium]|nr:hypothetical protein [Planctomycetaceae bacterium]
MRLTLRTLLAYMDDILEPTDHEELGKKIEASDFATELIHRSRDAVRRLRLGAPTIDAGEDSDDVLGGVSVADVNAVAEYLDNTLPSGDVADFERLCLEPSGDADMHLAEVVSCHHVLTMVLGEPAEIDNNLKQRIYQLPADLEKGQKLRIEPAHEMHQAAQPVPADTVSPPAVSASSPLSAAPAATPSPASAGAPAAVGNSEIPDYLRAASKSRGRNKRLVLATAAILFVAFVGWLMYPEIFPSQVPSQIANSEAIQFEGEVVIEELAESSPPETSHSTVPAGGEAPPFNPGADLLGSVPVSGDMSTVTGVEGEEGRTIEEQASQNSNNAQQPDAELGHTDKSAIPKSFDGGELEVGMPAVSDDLGAADSDITASVHGDSPKIDLEIETALPDSRANTLDADPGAEEVLGGVLEVGSSDTPTAPDSQEPIQLGNYLGNNDILLWLDDKENQWIRLPPRSALSAGDTLLALPKFRTHIVLGDMNFHLSGGTQLKLQAHESKEGSGAKLELVIAYGRLLLTAGLQGNRIALQFGEETRVFELESSSSLALEVRRVFVPESNYDEQSPVEVLWYLTSGKITWPSSAGDEQTIQAPVVWKTAESIDGLPENILELPKWIDQEQMTDSERIARDTLSEELVVGEPVALRLQELTDEKGLGRRREVRTLAAEASVYVGDFEPSVKALNDSAQSRRTWNVQIDVLRQAMARSPQVASQVHEAFRNLRGEEAAEGLMELLAGYSLSSIGKTREQRLSGALVNLIDGLENDSLDYRVLAIHNLNEITGTSYLEGYRPTRPIQRRQISVKKIWDRLESGDLLPAP